MKAYIFFNNFIKFICDLTFILCFSILGIFCLAFFVALISDVFYTLFYQQPSLGIVAFIEAIPLIILLLPIPIIISHHVGEALKYEV